MSTSVYISKKSFLKKGAEKLDITKAKEYYEKLNSANECAYIQDFESWHFTEWYFANNTLYGSYPESETVVDLFF